MKLFILIIVSFFSFSNVETTKSAFVFDIDETLCWATSDIGNPREFRERHPTLFVSHHINSSPKRHIFLPQIGPLLRFILDSGFDIHFFSAARKDRNEELIDVLLTHIFTAQELSTFRSQGQFKIFSRIDLISALLIHPDEQTSKIDLETDAECNMLKRKKVKCLRTVLPEYLIDNIILIDDKPKNALSYVLRQNENGQVYLKEDRAEVPLIKGLKLSGFKETLIDDFGFISEGGVLNKDYESTGSSEDSDSDDYYGLYADDRQIKLAYRDSTTRMLNNTYFYAGVIYEAKGLIDREGLSLREAVTNLLYPVSDFERIDFLCPIQNEMTIDREKFIAVGQAVLRG